MHSVSKFEPATAWQDVDRRARRILTQFGTGVASATKVTFAIATRPDQLGLLESEWNALFERSGRPDQVFQTFNWCWHWCNRFLPADGRSKYSLAIMTGRRDGRLVMVWPLVKERGVFVTQLKWLGEPVSQYGDVLMEEMADGAAVLEAAWQHIIGACKPDVAHLRKVRDDATVAPLLQRIGAQPLNRDEAPYLDLATAPDNQTYEQRYSKHATRNRRRLMRRMEERGAVAFERPRQTDAAARLAVTAIDLKRAWLTHRGIVSKALTDERTRNFFADVAGATARPVGCEVTALTSGGEPAALTIAFACKGTLAVHVLVYALAYEKVGAGVLHIEETIRQGFRDRMTRIDLLAPRDPYKTEWADGAVGVGDYAVPLTLAGRAFTRGYLGFLRPRLAALAGARSGGRTRTDKTRSAPRTQA